jgi:hypothetical protein
MIYYVGENPKEQEHIGPARNLMYEGLGHVRQSKKNGKYYVYERLPAYGRHPEQKCWMDLKVVYENPTNIRFAVELGGDSYIADLDDLGAPLMKEEIQIIIADIEKNASKKNTRLGVH